MAVARGDARAPFQPLEVRLLTTAGEHVALGFGSTSVRWRLAGARPSAASSGDGETVYASAAPGGGDILIRTRDGAIEDFVHYPTPDVHGAVYELVLERGVAGIRLVDDALELLDSGGAPRLRMEPPYVVDAGGVRHAAHVALAGCAADRSPAPPWGRPVVAPGATQCLVTIDWPLGLPHPLMLDPTWSTTASWSTNRQQHTATLLKDGRVLVAGGSNSAPPLTSTEIYDPATDTWAKTGSLAAQRSDHGAALLPDGRVLIAGQSWGAPTAEVWSAATGLWSATGAPKQGRQLPSLTALADGRVLLFGGMETNVGGGDALSTAELWSPSTATWSSAPSASEPRDMHTATLLADGRVFVVGGRALVSAVLASAVLFDPVAGAWSSPFPATARYWHTATPLRDGRILIAGGDKIQGGPAAEIFDPATLSFTAAGTMLAVPYGHAATALPDGDVLVVGGWVGVAESRSAQLFSPGANQAWTKLPDMARTRFRPTLTALPAAGDTMRALAAGTSTTVEILTGTKRAAACVANADCMTGHCEDGVCCDLACGGCRACVTAKRVGGPDGECLVIPRGNDPDDDCPTETPESCGRSGACDGAGACRLHAKGVACGPNTCSENSFYMTWSETRPTRDGLGKCDPHTKECLSAPRSCTPGIGCDTNSVPDAGPPPDAPSGPTWSCADATRAISSDGEEQFCAPYRCMSGVCASSCYDSSQCSGGTRCVSGRCVTDTAPAAANAGGCTSTRPHAPSAMGGAIALALAVGAAARRRRR